MTSLSRYLNDAYGGWFGMAFGCCRPQQEDEEPLRGTEKPMTILHHQPQLIPPPIPEPEHSRSPSREWAARTRSFASRASSRGSFSARRKFNSFSGSRRPQISAPTDFRHVQNALPRRTERFRPLELSIYLPENQLSPILPHFGVEDQLDLSPPPLAHVRSDSAMSFAIPRKPLHSHRSMSGRIESTRTSPESDSSEFVHPLRPRPSLPESLSTQQLIAALEKALPQTPPAARLRSNTTPVHREQIERVKSYLLEKEALEKQLRDIDSVIEERRSIYLTSRRGSIYAESEEPMPDMRTSDLERMPLPIRPRTAPTIHIPLRSKSFVEAASSFSVAPPPPPPLPLVLPRPPLRKKKSFSRVSNWLFPSTDHSRNISLDSITNHPKPVTSRDGFYQCIDLQPTAPASSALSTSSLSSGRSDSGDLRTETWTPDSSPTKAPRRFELARVTTFGEKTALGLRELTVDDEKCGVVQRLSSVGVAF